MYNNSFGIIENSYNLIVETLNNCIEVKRVYLFGSRANNTYRNGRDIDLAIEGENIQTKTIFKLSNILNEELPIPYKIDLINLNNMDNKVLYNNIIKNGVIIIEK